VNESGWTVRHPIYGGGGVAWETLRGTFSHEVQVQGGIEVRRQHLGIRGTVGVIPQEFTQEVPARREKLTLLLGGLSLVLYPRAPLPGPVQPYLRAGVGAQKARGDLGSSGFFLSGEAGVSRSLTPRLALDAGIQLLRLQYTQVDLENGIQKDLVAHPFSLLLGFRVGGSGAGR
jgi:hypothetical protein